MLTGRFLFVLALAAGCDGSAGGGPEAIAFEEPRALLGTIDQGPPRDLAFGFRTGSQPVRIDELETSCGCASPRLTVGGAELPLGSEIPPRTRGEVRVQYATQGFKGARRSLITAVGEGPGLPARLTIEANIRPWFELEPETLELGVLTGRERSEHEIVVRAREPFRLLEPVFSEGEGGPPFRFEGFPSAEEAREQRFDVVVEPRAGEEGQRRVPVPIRTSGDREFVLWIVYETAAPLWVRPGRHLLFGEVRPGVKSQLDVEIGAREGVLGLPEARIEGIPGASLNCVPFEEKPNHYRLVVTLPEDLPSGPFHGRLHLKLPYGEDGDTRPVERSLMVTGIVSKETDLSQP